MTRAVKQWEESTTIIKWTGLVFVYMGSPESEVGGPLAAATLDVTEAEAMEPPPSTPDPEITPVPAMELECYEMEGGGGDR